MTREEAVTVIEAFMENPLFSDVHKAAFNIAIHDIKAYHDWNVKTADDVLDNIRAEIERQERWLMDTGYNAFSVGMAFDAIKAVITESEE